MILKVLHYSLASPSPSTVITRFLHVCGRSPSRWPFARPRIVGLNAVANLAINWCRTSRFTT